MALASGKCMYKSCENTKKNCALYFFYFPSADQVRRDKWIVNCDNDKLYLLVGRQLSRLVVCQRHFTESCFSNSLHTRLTKVAIPTLDGNFLHDGIDIDFNEEIASNHPAYVPRVAQEVFVDTEPAIPNKSNLQTPFASASALIIESVKKSSIADPSSTANTPHELKLRGKGKILQVHNKRRFGSIENLHSALLKDKERVLTQDEIVIGASYVPRVAQEVFVDTEPAIPNKSNLQTPFASASALIIESVKKSSIADPSSTANTPHELKLRGKGKILQVHNKRRFGSIENLHSALLKDKERVLTQDEIVIGASYVPRVAYEVFVDTEPAIPNKSNLQTPCASASALVNESDKKSGIANPSSTADTPRELKLRHKVKKLQVLNKRKYSSIRHLRSVLLKEKERVLTQDEIVEGASHFVSDAFLTMLKMQMKHKTSQPWSKEEKEFALELYFSSPALYFKMRDHMAFRLPGKSTIEAWRQIGRVRVQHESV